MCRGAHGPAPWAQRVGARLNGGLRGKSVSRVRMLAPDSRGRENRAMTKWQVYRPLASRSARFRVRLPYAADNRQWLKDVCGAGTQPRWADGCWEIARPHYLALLAALPARVGGPLTVIEDFAEREVCTVSCTNANPDTSHLCECSCLGANHGSGIAGGAPGVAYRSGWLSVGEQALVQWNLIRRTYVIPSGA